ncbi:MAG: DMT family transporter [Halanaerobiales bacterium]|nr:DMT family transporter [Halanaerobiales bacterium]
MDKNILGSTYGLLSAIGFGTVPILALFAYQGGINVFTLLFLRFSLAALLLFVYIYFSKTKIQVSKKQLLKIFVMGGVFYSLFSFCYFSAIQYIPASLAVLIFYTFPFIIAGLSYFLGIRLTFKIVIAIVISFIGLLFVLGKTSGEISGIGILLASGAAVFYAVYTLYGDYILKDIPLLTTIAIVCLFAAVSFLTVGLVTNNIDFNFTSFTWIPTIGISVVSMLGFLAFFQGIKLTSPTSISALSMIEPIVTILLSIIFFGDSFNYFQIFGAILVLSGSFLVVLSVKKKEIEDNKVLRKISHK